jgi:hypothetical protein
MADKDYITKILQWLAEHVPLTSTGSPVTKALFGGDPDKPFREQYFNPSEDRLPRTADRPTGAKGRPGVWRRSGIDYPDVTITESLFPTTPGAARQEFTVAHPDEAQRKGLSGAMGYHSYGVPVAAHGESVNQGSPPNPNIPWSDSHRYRGVEIPAASRTEAERAAPGWPNLDALSGLGQHTRSIGKDPKTGEPYLSVFDVWDFEDYGKNRPGSGPTESLIEAIMPRLGEGFNVYDRMPLEELAGPPDPSKDEIARYRFKHHPDRGDESVYRAGTHPPQFDRTRTEEERERFRRRKLKN